MTANLPQGQLIIPNKENKNPLLLKDSPEELREKFYQLKKPLDVAKLLNIPFKRLVYHLYLVDADRRYKTFTIPKKSGGGSINIVAVVFGMVVLVVVIVRVVMEELVMVGVVMMMVGYVLVVEGKLQLSSVCVEDEVEGAISLKNSSKVVAN